MSVMSATTAAKALMVTWHFFRSGFLASSLAVRLILERILTC